MTATARRVLFVSRTTAHFSYFDSVISALLKRDFHVIILFDKEWSAKWRPGERTAVDEFLERHPQLETGWSVRRSDRHRERIFALRELRSYRSYLVRKSTTPFYVNRWKQYLPKDWRLRVENKWVDRALRTPLAGWLLRLVERMTPVDPSIRSDIERLKPDAVIVTPMNMRFSEETDYVKAAKSLGIPTVLPVLSWDNLSTKGLIHIEPDVVAVWNKFHVDDALGVQRLPRRKILVSGAPFFDKWFSDSAELPSREEFCERVGLDAGKPILLYLGSSKNIAKDESWFVEALYKALRESENAACRMTQILVRPHPANSDIYRRLNYDGIRVWPKNGALPELTADFIDMRTSFRYADAAIGINTSGMIDTVLADVPTFSVRIEEYSQTQENAVHFKHLQDADAIYWLPNVSTFVVRFAALLDGADTQRANRSKFSQVFARPNGLEQSAGDIIVDAVERLASGGNAH